MKRPAWSQIAAWFWLVVTFVSGLGALLPALQQCFHVSQRTMLITTSIVGACGTLVNARARSIVASRSGLPGQDSNSPTTPPKP